MAVTIRLARHGAKRRAYYRVVVADERRARDGRYIELLGTYDPNHDPAEIRLDLERVQYWLGKGARPSATVKNLIRGARSEQVA